MARTAVKVQFSLEVDADTEGDDRRTAVQPPERQDQKPRLQIVTDRRKQEDAEMESTWLCSEGVAHAGF